MFHITTFVHAKTTYELHHEKTGFLHMQNSKAQISCAVTMCNFDSVIPLPLQYSQNFKDLAGFCNCKVRFVSELVKNPEDQFSHVMAHIIFKLHRLYV